MPNITPKPYNRGEKLRRIKVLPTNAIFNDQDLNKQLESFTTNIEDLSKLIGLMRENWDISLFLITDTVVGGNITLKIEASILKNDSNLGAYVYHKGIRFDIPTGDAIKYSISVQTTLPTYPFAYFCLIAEYGEIGFAQDSTLCGVTGDGFPGSMPSVNVQRYTNERVVLVASKEDIVLAAGEQLIGIIATVALKDSSELIVTQGNNVDTFDTVNFSKSYSRELIYNAVKPESLFNQLKVFVGDEVLEGSDYNDAMGTGQYLQTNGSLIDVVLLLNNYMERKNRYLKMIMKHSDFKFGLLNDVIDRVYTMYTEMQTQVTALLNRPEIPIGAILPYVGDLSLFENTGAGKDKTIMRHFHICNGNGNTIDMRGRVMVGAITGIPSTSAPALSDETNPNNPALPAGTNPSYAYLDKNGSNSRIIERKFLPAEGIPFISGDDGNVGDYSNTNKSLKIAHADGGNLGYSLKFNTGTVTRGATAPLGEGKPIAVINPNVAVVFIQRVK